MNADSFTPGVLQSSRARRPSHWHKRLARTKSKADSTAHMKTGALVNNKIDVCRTAKLRMYIVAHVGVLVLAERRQYQNAWLAGWLAGWLGQDDLTRHAYFGHASCLILCGSRIAADCSWMDHDACAIVEVAGQK